MIYWVLLGVLGLVYIRIQKLKIEGCTYSLKKKIFMIITTAVLLFFAAFRSIKVGADSKMYRLLYEYVAELGTFDSGLDSWRRSDVEIGYYFLEYVFSHKVPYQCFLILTSAISIIPVMLVVYRYSKNYWMSLFLYIAFGYYSFSMNSIRQSIAIGLCMLAFIFAREKKFLKYILILFLACLFHKSAILFLPVYWIGRIKLKKSVFWLYVVVLFSAFLFKNQIFAILNMFSRQSFPPLTTGGGYRMFAVMLLMVSIGWIYNKRFLKEKGKITVSELNSALLIMVSVATVMWPIASVNPELNRMYYYYHIFIILYIPNLISNLKKNEKYLWSCFFVFLSSYYLYAYIINGELNYAPYYFFWQ